MSPAKIAKENTTQPRHRFSTRASALLRCNSRYINPQVRADILSCPDMAEWNDSTEKPRGSNQLSISTTTMYGYLNGIDRRKCHRVVPLRVLAFGPSRSGTSSLRIALDQLGFAYVYHYTSLLTMNPRDAEMWNNARDTHYDHVPSTKFERQDWDQLLGHCGAVTDVPSCLLSASFLKPIQMPKSS